MDLSTTLQSAGEGPPPPAALANEAETSAGRDVLDASETVRHVDLGEAASSEDVGDLGDRGRRAALTAAKWASAVDREGRFPDEALTALRAERLLGAMIPTELGGEGASLSALAGVCFRLGTSCASSAMIFAMHQISLACLLRHSGGEGWIRVFLRRCAKEQLLLASSTTEGARGGDVRRSEAALEPEVEGEGDRFRLSRAASVISYGREADAIVTTARRSPDAAAQDQALVVFEKADYQLTPTSEWRTLGMRGTSSAGFAFEGRARPEQILAEPYAEIHAQTMTPVAHLLWSSLWAGIAASAVETGRSRLRAQARSGAPPFQMAAHARATSALRALRALTLSALERFEALSGDRARIAALDQQHAFAALKVDTSRLAVEAVLNALQACGLAGYRSEGEGSVERQVRDILSAPLMINNERILADGALASLMTATALDLFEPKAQGLGGGRR